jgi:hypothetical protein
MKQVMSNVAMFKKIDAALQVVVFTILCIACSVNKSHVVWYMLTMAALHIISCITWSLFFIGDTPVYKAGRFIRRLFLVIMCVALPVVVMGDALFFYFAVIMLYLGPICGLLYFIITLLEINFYSKARKPYYLL